MSAGASRAEVPTVVTSKGRLVLVGATLLGGALREVLVHNGSIGLHRSSHALTFEEDFNLKWIPRGHPLHPVFISIFIFLKLEDLHLLLH